jgi:hypothetical protein
MLKDELVGRGKKNRVSLAVGSAASCPGWTSSAKKKTLAQLTKPTASLGSMVPRRAKLLESQRP